MLLYKYVSLDRIDILKNQKIRFTQYFNQNDPYECSLALLPLDREKELAEKDRFDAEKAQIIVQFKKNFHQFGMLCLTDDPKNLLMWSHYANNHKGFAIGFNINNTFFNSIEKIYDFDYGLKEYLKLPGFGTVKPIKYINERIKLQIGGEANLADIFFTKSIHWKYEKEYRIVKNILDIEPIDTKRQIHLMPFPKECVDEIIFGLNTHKVTEAKILSILNNDYGPDVQVKKARLKHLEFDIEFETIKRTR